MAKPRMIGVPSKPIKSNGYKPNPFGKRKRAKR